MFVEGSLADAVIRGGVLTAAALLWVLVIARIVGLRSFSKMTAFDFVATIATGSLLANAATASDWPGFVQSMAALVALFLVQFALAWIRQRSDRVRGVLDNQPYMLMRDGVIDEAALRLTRVARADVIAKLREANALDFGKVRAVVLEATGDISVLHGDEVDSALLDGVDRR